MTKLPSAEELDEELQTVGTQEKALELVHAYTIAVLEVAAEAIEAEFDARGLQGSSVAIAKIRALKEDL